MDLTRRQAIVGLLGASATGALQSPAIGSDVNSAESPGFALLFENNENGTHRFAMLSAMMRDGQWIPVNLHHSSHPDVPVGSFVAQIAIHYDGPQRHPGVFFDGQFQYGIFLAHDTGLLNEARCFWLDRHQENAVKSGRRKRGWIDSENPCRLAFECNTENHDAWKLLRFHIVRSGWYHIVREFDMHKRRAMIDEIARKHGAEWRRFIFDHTWVFPEDAK